MSLSKEVVIDKIEVLENGVIQIRQVTRVMEDGTQLSASYHRWALRPGDNISEQSTNVIAICNVAWTPEIIMAYQASVNNLSI